MPEGYKKRILQKPGQETQLITERPSEFYQLELPDFKIPTVTNSEDSVITGLKNRKGRDVYNQAYNEYLEQYPISSLSGIGYNPYIGTQFHPEVQRQQAAHLYAQDKSGYVISDPTAPYKQSDEKFANISSGVLGTALFAPEFTTYGLLGGAARIGGSMLGSGAGSKVGNELGYALDNTFKTRGVEPAGEIIGAFAGGGKGSRLLSNIAENRALKYISRTGKQLPKWFINYDPVIGKINARTIFAEDQTPKYNHNQLPGLNRKEYQSPRISQLQIMPQHAFASDFSGVENIESGNFGYGGVKPNLGLRKLRTEQRSKQLLDSFAEEQKRNATALNGYGKNWNDLDHTSQYGLKVNHGGEGNESLVVPRTNQTGLLSLNEDLPRESIPMGKRIGNIIRKAQSDLDAMNSYHIQNVEEGNKLNGKNFKPMTFRTDAGMSKILSKKDFINLRKQKKTNSPSDDVERSGAMYDPYEDMVYLRDDGISSGAYHEFLHQGQYGMRNPQVTLGRIGQLVDPEKVKSLNPRQAAYYLSEQELPVYLRQVGENANINVGDPYPGDTEFDKLLTEYPIFGSATFLKRNTPEEKRLFGRALNGTLFGLAGVSLIPKKQE